MVPLLTQFNNGPKTPFWPFAGGDSKMAHIWFIDFLVLLGISDVEITNFNTVLTIGPSYHERKEVFKPLNVRKSLKMHQK
jgi:hypothetical protein